VRKGRAKNKKKRRRGRRKMLERAASDCVIVAKI
jgi:hypothetical protein